MPKRKKDFFDNDLPPLEAPYLDFEYDGEKIARKKRGCIFAWIGTLLLLLFGLAGFGLYQRNAALRPTPTPTFPPDDGQPAQVDDGLFFADYKVSGERIQVYDATGQEITSPPDFVPVGLPVSSATNLPDALNAIAYPEGAFYDTDSGQLVVFGPPTRDASNSSADDFLTALRAIYTEQDPGVSIDPTGSQTVQDVRYIGQTEATHFGWVMFEADRLMKTLSMGEDNISGGVVTSSVPGFANMFDLELQLGSSAQDEVRRRFWFTVPTAEVEQNPDGQSMMITSLSLQVETEYLNSQWETLDAQPPDPAGKAFAAHLTDHYDEYAAEFPVFADLKALAHWTALAHWLKQADLPIEPELWLINSPNPYDAPLTTPAITVTEQRIEGNVEHTLMLWGGVDLGMELGIQPAKEATQSRLKGIVESFKARFAPVNITVSDPGLEFAALAPRKLQSGSAVNVPLPFEGSLQLSYSLSRRTVDTPYLQRLGTDENPYFLFRDPAQDFPVILHFAGHDVEHNTRIFVNRSKGWRLEEFADAYQLRLGRFESENGFSYDPSDFLLFDLHGKILQDARSGIEYTYDSERLTHIKGGGLETKISWNGDGTIDSIQYGDQSLVFQFENNLLVTLADQAEVLSRKFEYDEQGRLTREYDGQGNIRRMIRYDSRGRLLYQLEGGKASLYDWRPNGSVRLYSGASLIPWQAADHQALEELRTILRVRQNARVKDKIDHILFARRVPETGQVIILTNDRTYTVAESALQNPERLRSKLASLLREANAGDRVLISTGNMDDVNFQSLFPQAISLTVEKIDEQRILKNLENLSSALPFSTETAAIINGIPLPEQLGNVHLPTENSEAWNGLQEEFNILIGQAGFIDFARPGSAIQIQSSLSSRSSVLIVVAHSDGFRLYLPDGTPFAIEELSEEQKRDIAQQAPFVVLFSCDTAALNGGSSFSQKLLDLNARMVVAPNGKLPVDGAYEILKAFLANPKRNTDALEALHEAIRKIYPDGLLPGKDGRRDSFFKFQVKKLSPTLEENYS